MNWKLGAAGLALAAVVVNVAAWNVSCTSDGTALAAARVERGQYLVNTSGCHDCHTPWIMTPTGPGPDMSRMLSGHPQDLVMPPPPALTDGAWGWVGSNTNTAYAGPWGVSFAANLTPDENTGIKIWTEENFVNAIRLGRHWGTSRPILPPMPWHVYKNMTDEDLKSIYAYLQSIPPIRNEVPEPLPPQGDPHPAL